MLIIIFVNRNQQVFISVVNQKMQLANTAAGKTLYSPTETFTFIMLIRIMEKYSFLMPSESKTER